MAEEDKKKKKKKGVTAEVGGVKIKVKAKKGGKPKGEKKAKPQKDGHGAVETLAKLAESPIVADIIAVAATAAVAALAEQGLSKNKASGNAVKNAGKAAAAAIGRRLMEEFDAVKDAAKEAPKKA